MSSHDSVSVGSSENSNKKGVCPFGFSAMMVKNSHHSSNEIKKQDPLVKQLQKKLSVGGSEKDVMKRVGANNHSSKDVTPGMVDAAQAAFS